MKNKSRNHHSCNDRGVSLRCGYIVELVLLISVASVLSSTNSKYNYNSSGSSSSSCCVEGYSLDTNLSLTTNTATRARRVTVTHLFSSSSQPPPSQQEQRQPRRELQKRPRKNRKSASTIYPQLQQQHYGQREEDFPWDTAESRTIVSYAARESGEDYWYDMEELQRTQQQQKQQQLLKKKRYRDPNHISDSKLWVEVLSPYKQNWIGLISVSIIATAFIFKYFPEVINPPIIANIPEIL